MKQHYKGKNCIVTGGAGFIGQNLVKRLVSYGANVVVIDNFSYGASRQNMHPQATLIEQDIRDSHVFASLPKQKYDYFFHFAGPSSTVLFHDNLSDALDVTVRGFLNALRFAATEHIRFIYPSTGSLYNGVEFPHTETAELNISVQNDYAKAKIAIEQLAGLYRSTSNSLGLRILAGYGPGEMHKGKFQGVVYGFCLSMAQGKPPVIWGDGSQRRDFIFIEDIVDITLSLAIDCPERIVNIGTGTDIDFNELVAIINKAMKTSLTPEYVDRPVIYLEKTMADTTLLRKYYTKSFTPIEKGIKEVLKSLKEENKL